MGGGAPLGCSDVVLPLLAWGIRYEKFVCVECELGEGWPGHCGWVHIGGYAWRPPGQAARRCWRIVGCAARFYGGSASEGGVRHLQEEGLKWEGWK